MPGIPSDGTCFYLSHLLKHPASVRGAVMCDNASLGFGTCAGTTLQHWHSGLVVAGLLSGRRGRQCLVFMSAQKEF